ncbi:PREDICTED: uncharacterized protein LOC109116382 [Tarenaya hassleriana]|uniref:uncharacterized protein LOC109116382 n=1 Tax=Tarenaya hassleriana TaxID=28532 RepID=UPI0008FCE5D9|nr:PREDICTED: uncharacterized protein LOC109116382 [Tarenaya hassleriana]
MAPRRARLAARADDVPEQTPPPNPGDEGWRVEFRQFQETVWQHLAAHAPPPPPARDPEPREEEPHQSPMPAAMAGYLPIIKELRAMHTPRFEGSVKPEAAEEWLTQMSQDLEYLQCPYQYRALIASHHLSGQARHWWAKVVQEAPAGHRFTWEEFRQEFETKYFQQQDREYRVAEFLMLQQGDMTVSEYEEEFTRLLRYGGHLLEKVERGEQEEKEGKIRERSPAGRYFGAGSSGRNARSNDLRNKGKAPVDRAPPPLAARGPVICFRCDQPGHIASRCPTRPTGPPAPATRAPRPPGQASRPPRPPVRTGATPRVYALDAERDIQEEEEACPEGAEAAAIAGTLFLYGVPCYTLFDTGATHSFVSTNLADVIGTRDIEPRNDFTVRIPSGDTLTVHGVLRGVPLEVCGRLLTADLIVVPIGGFDVILGMDWLMKYQAYIDCPKRTIWFADEFGGFEFRGRGAPAADPIISALKAEKMIRKGNEAFLVVITATEESERRLEDTPVAREFPDVFPEDLPGLPPSREVDFSIDVLPGLTGQLSVRGALES